MAPELNNASTNEGQKQNNLDQEVREIISALTNRLGNIKPGSSSQNQDDEEQGVRIITIAGSNLGATMRGDIDDMAAGPQGMGLPEQEDSASYVVNSNFQAVNNSIMLGGSYKTNDPGVHLDITDYVDQHDAVAHKHGNTGRKSGKASRHHGGRSDNPSENYSEKN